MDDGNLTDKLRAIEQRLNRIERAMGLEPPVQPAKPPPLPVIPATTVQERSASPHDHGEQARPLNARATPVRVQTPIAPSSVMEYATAKSPPPIPRGRVEQTIGLKWAGWAGAIVLVIGAALGIKFAVDQGWLGHVPPSVRLMLMYAGGFAILIAGEIVYRRINVISAAAVFGAGVATLFVVSYAGHGLYKLYDPETAFVLMGASTLIGAAVAVRGKLVSIAVLSLIGGNIAPAILGGEPRAVPFLSYLLMLQIVALALAWWGVTGKWWILRFFALATTTLWMFMVLNAPQFKALNSPLIFTLIFAGLFQIELIASAMRSRRAEIGDAAGGSSFSMLVTALAVAAVLHIFAGASEGVRGAWVLGFSVICAIAGFALRPRGPAVLSVSYRIQAAGLLVVAVPVALNGAWITVAWGVLGLAFAALGATMNLNIARTAGIATWMLALAHLYHWSVDHMTYRDAADVWLRVLGQGVAAYAILAYAMTWVGHGVAWLTAIEAGDSPNQRRDWGRLTAMVASLAWVVASIAALPPLGASAMIVIYAWLMLGMDCFAPATRRLQPLWHVAGALVLAAAKWMLVDTLERRLSPNWSATEYEPFFNPAMAMGVLIALSLLAVYMLRRRELAECLPRPFSPEGIGMIFGLLALLVILWSGSFEIDRYFETRNSPRAKQTALSVFWGVFAVACVVAGFRWRAAGLRYFGLGLFAVTLVKIVAIDLDHIGQGYRILSFMALGLLLLGTSVLYGKLSPKLLADDESARKQN